MTERAIIGCPDCAVLKQRLKREKKDRQKESDWSVDRVLLYRELVEDIEKSPVHSQLAPELRARIRDMLMAKETTVFDDVKRVARRVFWG